MPRTIPYKYQCLAIRTTGFTNELLRLRQQFLVRPFVQPIKEIPDRAVLLEVDILDVLSVRTVDRH